MEAEAGAAVPWDRAQFQRLTSDFRAARLCRRSLT